MPDLKHEAPSQRKTKSHVSRTPVLTSCALDKSVSSQQLERVNLKQHSVEQQFSCCRPFGWVFLDAQAQEILRKSNTNQLYLVQKQKHK